MGLSREVYKQYIKISPDSVLVLCGGGGGGGYEGEGRLKTGSYKNKDN